jgi:hypothetical protein
VARGREKERSRELARNIRERDANEMEDAYSSDNTIPEKPNTDNAVNILALKAV